MKDLMVYCDELQQYILIDVLKYGPERMAPPCSNPDSPNFSDSGDPAEIDFTAYTIDINTNKKGIEIPDKMISDNEWDILWDKVHEEIKEQENNDYTDYEMNCGKW